MESKVANNTFNCRSLSMSLQSHEAGIAQLLQQQILAAISLSGMSIAVAGWSGGVELTFETIPLHRLPDDTHIIYRSAIAFKLAPLLQRPAFDIANQLTTSLATDGKKTPGKTCLNQLAFKTLHVESNQPPTSLILHCQGETLETRGEQESGLDFDVEVVFPGWIHFRLNDWSLAVLLQKLIQMPVTKSVDYSTLEFQRRDDSPTATLNCFPVQYAHARCCSLLRLAHQQGLITLKDLDFKTLDCQLLAPNPISWLKDEQEAATGQLVLRLVHPAERCLIAQMLDVIDASRNLEQLRAAKLANALSKAFEEFYSCCRIWGEVKTQTPKLAQARLGLVGITQGALRSFLQDQLGVSAPVEL